MNGTPFAYYELCDTADPEERLEDAALFKALYDAFGGRLAAWSPEAPVDALRYGREKRFQPRRSVEIRYWEDPAFLRWTGRAFTVCRWEDAEGEVSRLHSLGKRAFVKSTKAKHYICRVPVGLRLSDVAEDMAFSFIDGGPLVMVQEEVRMRFEHRFFVVGRKIVTHSPNAVHLTPIDYPQPFGFETPAHRAPSDSSWWEMAHGPAQVIAREMQSPDAVIDMAIVDGRPVCVEINPLIVGGVGLFASNVRALAAAIYDRDEGLFHDGGEAVHAPAEREGSRDEPKTMADIHRAQMQRQSLDGSRGPRQPQDGE